MEYSLSQDLPEPDPTANELKLSRLPVESDGGISDKQLADGSAL